MVLSVRKFDKVDEVVGIFAATARTQSKLVNN